MVKPPFILVLLLAWTPAVAAQTRDWCKELPRAEYKTLERVRVSDPWFEVYRVAPDTLAIYEPHQAEEVISYLLIGKEKTLLFDTGMGISDMRRVVQELTKVPVIVLNSHTHNDHVGDNWQFDTVYGMDTEFTRQNARGSVADAQEELGPGQICGELPAGFDHKGYRTKPWTISRYIHDRERIDLGERAIEVIATPGHTPDSICLLDEANGLLFTGDTFYPATIWLYRPETDFALYEASVRRLEGQQRRIKLLLGAHNVPVAPPSELLKLAVAAPQLREVAASGKNCQPEDVSKKFCTVEGFRFLLPAQSKK